MNKPDQIGNTISDLTFRDIEGILQRKEKLDSVAVDTIIRDIERARIVSLTIIPPEKPSSVRKELEKLRNSVPRLLDAIEHTSDHTAWALFRAARLDSDDKDLLDFDSNKGPGYELFRLKKHVQMVKKATDLAIEKEVIAKGGGTSPNIIARHLAFHVLIALERQAIKCTSYQRGTYFNILAIVFDDVLPELGSEAYPRHGRWALANPVIDMESMVVDPRILRTQ